MKIENLVKLFIDYVKDVKRYSPNTVKSYSSDLEDFLEYCKEKGKNEIVELNERFIKSYMIKLTEEGIGKNSISRKLSTIRSLFKFSYRNELIEQNPTAQIKNPKVHKKLPEITSVNSILKIYQLAEEAENPKHAAMIKVIFELLYGCSLRVSELCDLKIKDINFRNNTLRVFGKGSKMRIVPVGEKSKLVIEDYLNNFPSDDYQLSLVRTEKGNKLYPKYVYRLVNKYLSKVTDIRKKSPHILRHSSATHMLDSGADLQAVKEILGHENLSTTQIYTHVSIERLKATYKKSHPKS
jgi:site-specific recombinase XerD